MQDVYGQVCVPRFYIGKVGISSVTMAKTLKLIEDQACEMSPAYICIANAETTVLSQRDSDFCRIQNESLLTVPDGMPLIWYARIKGEKSVERITGHGLMKEILQMSPEYGYTHYFYGDTKETLLKMKKRIHSLYPGAEIRGMYSPPFRPLRDYEIHDTITEINRLKPTFVWVALGAPKQERWMVRVLPHIDSSILIGVGAAFRFLTGEYRDPPIFVKISGLTGLFWRRSGRTRWYCYHIPAFGILMLKGFVRRVFWS